LARRLVLLLALAALAMAPAAWADADPASDYLLGQPTFVPPDDNIPPAYADQLNAAVREAKARGYVIRVALLGTVYDMGGVTILFKQPKRYARFLGTELSLVYKGDLLVVMPNGLGVSRGGKALPAKQAVVDRLPPPGTDGPTLARTATRAVIRLAAADGVIVPEPPLASSGRSAGSNENRDRLVIGGAALAAALLVAAFLFYRRRVRA
jgi:hypothetical protein